MTAKHSHKQSQTSKPRVEADDSRDDAQEEMDAAAADEATSESTSDQADGAGSGAQELGGEHRDDGGESESDAGDESVRAELESARERYLRLAAEFDNFRKRTERERLESFGRAQGQLAERLLDALDDLQRVGQQDAGKTSAAAVLEGIQLVERKLLKALESAGLEPVEAVDQPFDPEVHEAIAMVPTDEREQDDTVSDVFQTGYRFKGNLIRPARVRVRQFQG